MISKPTGMIAHMPPGSVVLSPRAVEVLAGYLRTQPEPPQLDAQVVRADLIRLSRHSPTSRDSFHKFMAGEGCSELTTSQAARRLGISPGAVRKRISRGKLPATFNGRHWLINPQDVEGSARHVSH